MQVPDVSLERLRRRYRPAQIKLLFIGEAPPASGRFFYRQNSGLYRAMRDAFCVLDPSITDDNFLAAFQNLGCYLIDACASPVDQRNSKSRREACRVSEPGLGRAIKKLQPQAIATLVRSTRSNVERAVAIANWTGPLIDLPYPGRWSHHRKIFLNDIEPLLSALATCDATQCSGIR